MIWILSCDQVGGSELAPATYVTLAICLATISPLSRGDDGGWLGSLEALVVVGCDRRLREVIEATVEAPGTDTPNGRS